MQFNKKLKFPFSKNNRENSDSQYIQCNICKKTVSPQDIIRSKICSQCWNIHLAELREFYGEYHKRLKESLASRNICVSDASTDGLDDKGRPLFPVIPVPTNCIPLRKDRNGLYGGDECAIYTVSVNHAVFAIPDNGLGIRYIKGSLDKSFMDQVYQMSQHDVLALARDDKELYLLNKEGLVLSTKDNWKPYSLFHKLEEIKRITYGKFSPKQIADYAKEVELGIHTWSWQDYTYDHKQKAFIWEYESGCSHEGIYQEYSEMKKDKIINRILHWSDITNVTQSVKDGIIPPLLILEYLPVHEEGALVVLPESYQVY